MKKLGYIAIGLFLGSILIGSSNHVFAQQSTCKSGEQWDSVLSVCLPAVNRNIVDNTQKQQQNLQQQQTITAQRLNADGSVNTDPAAAEAKPDTGGGINDGGWVMEHITKPTLALLSTLALRITSLILGIGAVVLNGSIYYTIVKMAENYASIPAIDNAWSVVRDIANMGFIFVLLYAAITTIIGTGSDNKKLIVNMVIAAILVNFSLFFTKLVIDASNLLTLTLYKAMVPATGFSAVSGGLGDSIMQALGLQSLYKLGTGIQTTGLDALGIVTLGVMGSLMLIIAGFIFFAVAIMFIIRYVVFIFLMVLSPIYFVGGVLPGLKKYTGQWAEALKGQAFFAPIYMLLTYISISILAGIRNAGILGGGSMDGAEGLLRGANPLGLQAMFINFIVVIAFLVFSLVVAKEWSGKAPGIGKLTSWATGVAGGATIGLAGKAGRMSLGAYGSHLADNEKLKEMAENKDNKYTRLQQMRARMNIKAGQKISKQSFDLRATGIGGALGAGKAQKGGFAEDTKKSAEAKKKFGESLGPSAIVTDEARLARDAARKKYGEDSEEFKLAQKRVDDLDGVSEDEQKKRQKKDIDNDPTTKRANEIQKQIDKADKSISKGELELETLEEEASKALLAGDLDKKAQLDKEIEDKKKFIEETKNNQRANKVEIISAKEEAEQAKKRIEKDYEERKKAGEFNSAGDRRKKVEANWLRDSRLITAKWNPNFMIPKSNKQAAADLRKGGKKVEDMVKDVLKASGEVKDEKKEEGSGGESEKSGEKKPTEVGGSES